MYDNGDRNVAAFSHGGAIMFWVFLNAENADPMWLMTNPLRNTGYVVVEGNPEDGWRVVNWNGTEVGPETAFHVEVLRQVRTLSRQLDAAVQQVTDSFATRDPAAIATAINRSIADASFSVTKFSRAINAEVIERVNKAIPKNEEDLREEAATGIESVNAAADDIETVADATTEQVESAVEPATTGLRPTVRTRSVATDLTDGNKAVPGVKKAVTESGERVRAVVENTRDQVASSVRNLRDAVKKATGQAKPTAADNESSGEKDAA
ncbi:hypothetical protein [Mycolicibacterium sp. HK-90]|uniref:hypothetical protein n=1 Tax=Mycolicibacterium sp. HK-90 TaxID=3056937 RepID=UPI002659685A|nr:hypothetical protein [Mycolicibacterium sp. HK-90]WKG02836.1 hypothetical protein QU592_27200 [Mycolicibacterium sp. HK-90]